MRINPYLLDALHSWGSWRRDEDISGLGYASETMEARMMAGTAWSRGGETADPEYRPNDDVRRIRLVIDALPSKLQLVLWAGYVGRDGPMSEDLGRQACGVSLGEYRDLMRVALSRVADGLNMSLYTR